MKLARDRTVPGVSIGGTKLTCSGTVNLIILAFNCAE